MILTKSEGNPFFIEELIRSLIDMELIYHEGERWKARKEIEGIDVPDTIQSVLLSRVDRLNAETKYVLQCASVIGRLFRYRLLDHIARHERDLEAHLTELESKDLINAERTVPELEYAFKHALTQEATYQSILERKRREFHLQVAQGIEKLYSGRLEEYYEELAEHYSKSDDEKALEYLIKAGDKSKAIYANQQAIGYYTRAMNIVNQFPEKTEQRLSILDGLGDVYILIGKPDEALQSYESALECSTNNRRRADIYRKITGVYGAKFQPDLVLKYIDIAIKELGQDTHSVEMANIYSVAMWMYGYPPWSGHDYDKALDYGLKALSIVEGTEYKRELAEIYEILGYTCAYKGDYDKAIQYSQKVLAIGQEINNAWLLGGAYWTIALAYQRSNPDWRIAVEHYNKSIELLKKTGDIHNMVSSYVHLGHTYYVNAKDYESAIKCFKACLELDKERKFIVNTGHAIVHLSQIYRDKGEWDEAIKYAQEGLQTGGRDDRWITLIAYEVLIDAYLAKGELDKVIYYIKEPMNLLINQSNSAALAQTLGYAEDIYEKIGKGAEFISFCREIIEKNAEKLKEMKLTQWYLEPKELSEQFTQTALSDEFDGSALLPEWQWIAPKCDCSYGHNIEQSWLVIRAASDCDLYPGNLDAPRLLQGISGDFAIETQIAPADEEAQAVGGLLVWKDENNFIRFEKGMRGKNNIELSGSVNGKWDHFGRGMLISDTIYMRIERIGDTLSAYCSNDRENWLTCGEVSFPTEDPIQVGIHAIGNTGADRGSVPTATRFDYFRVLRKPA
jgi:predicted ATPase